MRSFRSIALSLAAVSMLVSCNRDPEVAKRRYLESGNKYFEKGRFKEASLQYRNALKIHPRYGEAHYKLGLTWMKSTPPEWGRAVQSLRRAVELLPPDQPDRWDAVVKLTEIYLSPLVKHDKQVLDEVAANCAALLKRDPNSFDGHRLTGDLQYIKAVEAIKSKAPEGADLLAQALDAYRKADAVKPGDIGVTMQLARGLAVKGDLAGAEAAFRRIIAKDKSFREAYHELYTLLFLQNRRPEAEQILRSGYQANPKDYRYLIWLAEQYVIEQRRDDMLGVLQQLKSKAGEYDRAYLDVGDFYLRVGDGDSAVREYREGMSKDAKKKDTYQKRIVEALMRQGKRADAAKVNEEILKDNPNDTDARGVAATLLLEKGDVSKALGELQQVVTRAPENPVARYNLARAYLLRGDPEQARQHLQKAIELRNDYLAARLALAQLQVSTTEYDAAIRSTQDVLGIDANNASAKLIQSSALMGEKKYADARQLLQGMLASNASSPDVLFQLGVLNLAEKQYKQAEDSFRRAYQLNPANTRGLMGVVETYMAQDRQDQALQVLETESAKTPARMDFHLALGNVAVRAGRWDLAIAEFQKVLDKAEKGSKTEGEIHLRMGETYRRRGDINAAIRSLQAARQTLPEDTRVLSTLGLALDAAARWPEAKQVYEATIKLNPNNGIVLNNLAYGLAEHGGDLDQALTMAQRAKSLHPQLPEVNDTLGWIFLKKNLPDNAIDIFRDLVTKNPNHATFQYHLGMAYSQKGDKPKAVSALKRALELNPPQQERRKIEDLIRRLG